MPMQVSKKSSCVLDVKAANNLKRLEAKASSSRYFLKFTKKETLADKWFALLTATLRKY